jgi:hypothetical protein
VSGIRRADLQRFTTDKAFVSNVLLAELNERDLSLSTPRALKLEIDTSIYTW